MQQHAAIFFAEAKAAGGGDVPQSLKDEFDAFLECGNFAYRFPEAPCRDCGRKKQVAFSCKRRGF